MSSDLLTEEARHENALTLSASLGGGVSSAAQALDFSVCVTADLKDKVAWKIAEELVALLGRTVRHASLDDDRSARVEVVIGSAVRRLRCSVVSVCVKEDGALIGHDVPQVVCATIPSVLRLLVACFAAGAALQEGLSRALPVHLPDPLKISFGELGIDSTAYALPIELGDAYLAGAGAIGNGLLWALRHLDVRGSLTIADDDVVSSGNLNRQIWFTAADLNFSKAKMLASHAQPFFQRLNLVPRKARLQELPDRNDGAWLARLIVAVDSRRARRRLQNEFPGEVFDASTTDIREIVLHYNKSPSPHACLSCVYEPDEEEITREQHIAEHLGVSAADVRSERISAESAKIIASKFHGLQEAALEGIAYDTLFKRLCSEGQLTTQEGRRVLAPFAFVSVLAGTLLALELIRRLGAGNSERSFNYWRVSPWHPMLGRRRVLRPQQPNCSFCTDMLLRKVNSELWNSAR